MDIDIHIDIDVDMDVEDIDIDIDIDMDLNLGFGAQGLRTPSILSHNTQQRVMAHIWKSHVTRMDASCYTYG